MNINMKLFTMAFCILLMVAGCQKPYEFVSQRNGNGINSITASFPGEDSADNSFKGEIDI